jgi:hypothetical protein
MSTRRARQIGDRSQGVLKDGDVALDGGSSGGRIARDACHIDLLPVEEGRNRQKSQESRQVADQRFGFDLFADVELDIGVERGAGIIGLPHERNASKLQDAIEFEICAELSAHERKHGAQRRAAGEQTGRRGLEPARARAEQRESPPAGLDGTVLFVQERRYPLDFIEDDHLRRRQRGQFQCQESRIGEERLIAGLIEQIQQFSRQSPVSNRQRSTSAVGCQSTVSQ